MITRRLALAVVLTSLASAARSPATVQTADLIVTNARIDTVDENRPVVEAMAIRDGRAIYQKAIR
jgi:hypothetical protein